MTVLPDRRIQSFFEMNAGRNHRSFVALLGEHAKTQIPTIHRALKGHSHGAVETVVWCHRNDATRRAGREVSAKKQKSGAKEGSEDAVAMFIKANDIEFIEYRESERMLGRTVDMLILQDFEALSPNLIATSMETVRGGGAVVLLLDSTNSIEALIARKTELHERIGEFKPRYNKRLFKSLVNSGFALFLDDGLRILDGITKVEIRPDGRTCEKKDVPDNLQGSKREILKALGRTRDQVCIIEEIFNALETRRDRTIFSITASRGRGKSAALGISIAQAVNLGLLSVYIASPTIENVKTVFLFLISGLEKLGYKKYVDFKIVYQFRGNKRFIHRIEFVNGRKQIIEYFNPLDELKYYPDLLVVDEAAAIPLTYLMKLIFPNFVIMATTVNGYEGTGRAFSIKLSEALRKSSAETNAFAYKELAMKESIRYGEGDPVENWLYGALLLDASVPKIEGCPSPSSCSLFYVDKNMLFSGKPATEKFLNGVFSLFTSSHYRNSPNDLQILADSPRHELFALVTPVEDNGRDVPKVICSLQVSFEGRCRRTEHLREGNLIPWVVSEEHLDASFLDTYGARVVRIAVHPEYVGMGYGSISLDLLIRCFSENARDIPSVEICNGEGENVLLHDLCDITVPRVAWIGASFGVTEPLYRFWSRSHFLPIGMKQAITQETGEHSAIFIRSLRCEEASRIDRYNQVFMSRFVGQLSTSFRNLTPSLSLSLLSAPLKGIAGPTTYFTPDDICRVRMASTSKIDLSLVIDLIPDISRMYFHGKLRQDLSVLRKSVLLMAGSQGRSIEKIAELLTLKPFQVINILTKVLELLVGELERNYTATQD